MHIAILTFDEYNELDSFIAYSILNRIKKSDWRVSIASNKKQIRSMNGLLVESHIMLSEANYADAVIFGSGMKTQEIVQDQSILQQFHFNPERQLLASQCSGILFLSKLGLLTAGQACTDLTTKPWVEKEGICVLDQPFYAKGNVATSGGCLASVYLATWVIARLAGVDAAKEALYYVAPVHEKEDYINRTMENVQRFI